MHPLVFNPDFSGYANSCNSSQIDNLINDINESGDFFENFWKHHSHVKTTNEAGKTKLAISWLSANPQAARRITKLDLDDVEINYNQLLEICQNCPNIESLSCFENSLTSDQLRDCLLRLPKLKILDLGCCENLDNNSIPFSFLNGLTRLDISSNDNVNNEIFDCNFPSNLTELLIDFNSNMEVATIPILERLTLLKVSIEEVEDLNGYLNKCKKLKSLQVMTGDEIKPADVLAVVEECRKSQGLPYLEHLVVDINKVTLPFQSIRQDSEISMEVRNAMSPVIFQRLDSVYSIRGVRFMKIKAEPDGSCLFTSLRESGLMADEGQTIKTPEELRIILAQYIKENRGAYQPLFGPDERESLKAIAGGRNLTPVSELLEEFENLANVDYEQCKKQSEYYTDILFDFYVELLQETKMFAGHLEILAAANLYRKPIYIYPADLDGKITGEPQIINPDEIPGVNVNKPVHLLRELDHYDALLQI